MGARSTPSRLFICLCVCAGACKNAVVHRSVQRLFLRCWLAEGGQEKLKSPLLQWLSILPFPHRHILTLLTQTRASWLRVQQVCSFRLWREYTLVHCEVCKVERSCNVDDWHCQIKRQKVAEYYRKQSKVVKKQQTELLECDWIKRNGNKFFFFNIAE